MTNLREALLLSSLLLFGCSSDQLPPGAILVITPTERTIQIDEIRNTDGQCIHDPEFHVDLPVLLHLQDANGVPIGDAAVRVYVDFAENTFSGLSVLELYKDSNGNGVVDAPQELVSGGTDSIASFDTSEYGGEAMLLLRANLSCAYRGEIFAYAGSATASSTIDVQARNVVVSEVTEQPEGE